MNIRLRSIALYGVLVTTSLATAQSPQSITEYPIPTPNSGAEKIAAGSDGALWFTEFDANKIGRITTSGTFTEYPLPSQSNPSGITAGPDGAMWFIESYRSQIGRITAAGGITIFPLPAGTYVGEFSIITGPDGALWFPVGPNIGRLTTEGVFTEYVVPNASFGFAGSAADITVGPDGALWFTEDYADTIGRITTDGAINQFAVPVANFLPGAITAGPDGALWFTGVGNTIERMTTNGIFTVYGIPGPNSPGPSFTTGPDGALYFADTAYVGRLTTAGVPGVYTPPFDPLTGPVAVASIAKGPDGAIWFVSGNNIGRIGITSVSLQVAAFPTLRAGAVGTGYYQPLLTTGGTLPYAWSVVSGSLPAGLSLSAGGVISGTPLSAGSQTFTVRLTDAASSSVTQPFSLTIGPAGCFYALGSGGEIFTAAGGSGSVNVSAPAGCTWTVSDAPSWLTISSAANGSGNGTVTYVIAPNGLSTSIDTTLTIGGIPFTIDEAPFLPDIFPGFPESLNFVGAMPHLAAEGGWSTTLTFVNKGSASAVARTSLFASDGSPLALPINVPGEPATPQAQMASSIDQTIAPNALFVMQAYGAVNVPYVEGSAKLAATTGNLDGFAIFHMEPSAQEAVVPMETRNAASYLLAFDNTNGIVTGIALENSSPQPAAIPLVLRGDTGARVGTGTVSLNGSGHTSFVLSDQFPVTANIRGTVEVDTPTGGRINVLGIRDTRTGQMTTIPAMANVTASGGSMPHIASGDGWSTTFALVNTGATAAQATLSFFDDNGIPLSLPVTLLQTGQISSTSSTTQTIPANGTLWMETSQAFPGLLVTGSAQLSTTGNVSGFAIFGFSPFDPPEAVQEAVVPLETRNASSYVLAYDNTNGIVTGLAVSAVSTQAVTIPVILRDGTGAQNGTGSIPLAANGHTSQILSTLFPATANIRGTVEFDKPAGAQISVLGIRSPPALTFTTLPALAN